jgi:hypothetical protein
MCRLISTSLSVCCIVAPPLLPPLLPPLPLLALPPLLLHLA